MLFTNMFSREWWDSWESQRSAESHNGTPPNLEGAGEGG